MFVRNAFQQTLYRHVLHSLVESVAHPPCFKRVKPAEDWVSESEERLYSAGSPLQSMRSKCQQSNTAGNVPYSRIKLEGRKPTRHLYLTQRAMKMLKLRLRGKDMERERESFVTGFWVFQLESCMGDFFSCKKRNWIAKLFDVLI